MKQITKASTIDVTRFSDDNAFDKSINHLADILHEAEPGTYELGVAVIEVKKIVNVAENQVVVKNPPFDYSLLTIE
jgi:hypothetical protein